MRGAARRLGKAAFITGNPPARTPERITPPLELCQHAKSVHLHTGVPSSAGRYSAIRPNGA